MQQFYRPNGDSTQHRGVVSDIELPSLTTHLDVGEADLEYSLPFAKVDPVRYKPVDMVEKSMDDVLAAQSRDRVAKSQDFQKELRRIARYKQQKERKRVTLNEKEYMDYRKEVNTDKEEEKMVNPRNEKNIERNYYLDEAIRIALDYAALLSQKAGAGQLAGPKPAAATQ